MSINAYPNWPAKLASHGYCYDPARPGSCASNAIPPNNDPPKPPPYDPRYLADEEIFHQQRVQRILEQRRLSLLVEDEPEDEIEDECDFIPEDEVWEDEP